MSNKVAWSRPVSFEEACRRAGGRRRYNAVRQFKALLRRQRVVELLLRWGMRRGVQSRIAVELGVHRSTVSKDVAALLPEHPPCPECDRPMVGPSPAQVRRLLARWGND